MSSTAHVSGSYRWGLAAWVAICLLAGPAAAQSPVASDSTAADSSKSSVLVLPNVFYTPETKIAGGLVLGYFTTLDAQSPPSSVQFAAIYTQRHQFYVKLSPELYWHQDYWRMSGSAMFSRYPDTYYGIGPSTSAAHEEDYTAHLVDVRMGLQRMVGPGWRLGPKFIVRFEDVTEVEDGGLLATESVSGRSGGTTVGVGVVLSWDGRDNLYFPREGRYLELGGTVHPGFLGSDFNFGRLSVDARQYVPVRGTHVLALNGYLEAVTGATPFQLMPLLGGGDRMRGYREGRYRDNLYAVAQAGYRFPLFWRFKGTLFGNVGNVARRVDAFSLAGAKYAVGAGLRLRLNDEGIHGRVDYALSPEGGTLYITLLEAF